MYSYRPFLQTEDNIPGVRKVLEEYKARNAEGNNNRANPVNRVEAMRAAEELDDFILLRSAADIPPALTRVLVESGIPPEQINDQNMRSLLAALRVWDKTKARLGVFADELSIRPGCASSFCDLLLLILPCSTSATCRAATPMCSPRAILVPCICARYLLLLLLLLLCILFASMSILTRKIQGYRGGRKRWLWPRVLCAEE
jgi:hypothetical protein